MAANRPPFCDGIICGMKTHALPKFLVAVFVFAVSFVPSGCSRSEDADVRSYVNGSMTVYEMDGVRNLRDLGGWTGRDGRMVRRGRVFRSGALNRSYKRWYRSDKTLSIRSCAYLVETLGVKTDVDLRNDQECEGMEESPLGSSVVWRHIPFWSYVQLSTRRGRAAFAEIFRVFLDEANYPILFHCQLGRDRAGTVALVLNALLGVSEDDLRYDWAFSEWSAGKRNVSFEKIDDLTHVFLPYPGRTLNEKVEAFVKSLGFTEADIDHFRALMLEPAVE